MADLRCGTVLGIIAAIALGATGCGSSSASSSAPTSFRQAQVERAFVRAKDTSEPDLDYWVNPDFHSHADFVPNGSVEVCPLTQRADTTPGTRHIVVPVAGQPTRQFVVERSDPEDHLTPKIQQGALVFGTNTIAAKGMARVAAQMVKCPPSYVVHGGPPQILGTYSLSSRPVTIDGWTGISQQLAHTYQATDVYYEDVGHVVVQRANVILDVLVSHEHVVGDRADARDKAQDATKSIVDRLNG